MNELHKTRVLLVEDDPDDAMIIKECLQNITNRPFETTYADRLEGALEFLRKESFEVVLLDLSLPDSLGLSTLAQVNSRHPDIPIIVLTGLDDDVIAMKAIQEGAQDFLVKNKFDSGLLGRSIRYAIERQRYLIMVEESWKREQEGLYELIQKNSKNVSTGVTADFYYTASLQKSFPDIYNEFEERYKKLIELALEQRQLKVDHDISNALKQMADELGFLGVGPRDVVQIHGTSIKKMTSNIVSAKAQAYVEEGRIMILELMGYLVSFYRNYFIGPNK